MYNLQSVRAFVYCHKYISGRLVLFNLHRTTRGRHVSMMGPHPSHAVVFIGKFDKAPKRLPLSVTFFNYRKNIQNFKYINVTVDLFKDRRK